MKAGIDHFTKKQFEAALPNHKDTGRPLWVCAGLIDGEWVYHLPVGGEKSKVIIEIRSSVGADGRSAESGDNSIRAYLIWFNPKISKWMPLGSKVQKYVTRLPGWADRLTEMLRTLYAWRLDAGNCSKCGMPKGIFKVTKVDSPHKGQVFCKCPDHNEFRWLDITKEAGK